MKKILAFVAISALVSSALAWSRCPRSEDLLPCTCIRPHGYTKVTCSGVKDEVTGGLRTLSHFWMGVDDVVIISKDFDVLTDRIFGKTTLHTLELRTPKLKTISEKAFNSNERDLQNIKIYESSIQSLDDVLPSLRYIFRIVTILIQHSPGLTTIPANAFTHKIETYNLFYLDLSFNAITTVGDKAFDALTNLYTLNLVGNKISAFEPSAIHAGNRIKKLNLNNNIMTSVPVGLITRINRYQQIFIENNSIVTVPLADLRTVAERLVHVHLEGNKIACDKHFKVIAVMNVEHRKHLLYGTCATPKYLSGIKFKELNTTDF